ncbi:hypothetical protein SLEP1_g44089 [Rubroshorea leprosula]|uniref:SNRNP25 ubiquitin-like domain-containing protein n=1 Tax=Rubroshorea leprosula TaxID=152421 RepID=A0AAV5LF35_9ROSI|nr:hypothetical protein SLEP1_g44089 [Rubroshorea leprosula]
MLTDAREEDNGSRDFRTLNLFERRCLAPRSLNISNGGVDDGTALVRRVPYHKLPQQSLFKLSVLKLDGSLFDVRIAKNATVAELKQAIEELFSSVPGEVQGNISWSHVWGHFCLSYGGQKLINDKARIQNLGIKDGDQLEFSRHISMNHSPLRRRSKNHSALSKRQLSGSNAHQEREQNGMDCNDVNENRDDRPRYHNYEDEEALPITEFKLTRLFKGWLSNSSFWGYSRRVSEGRNRPTRFALQCLGGRS